MFDLQGHRGARGLKPENTLPSFEAAIEAGVSSIETDLHLTRDDEVVLIHDPIIDGRLIRSLTLAELRRYRVDGNPDPRRFPEQEASVTPRAADFAARLGIDPYTPPTLQELFAFAALFPRAIGFDLELKRVPGRPQAIGDGFDGTAPGLLERRVVDFVQQAGVGDRTTVRSFDHRAVRFIRDLQPDLTTAVLIAGTAPVDPGRLARDAGAAIYCPQVGFLDEAQVKQCHAAGVRVLPWTVNDPEDWRQLLAWGVDGITTDFPHRLAAFCLRFASAERGGRET